MPKIADETIVSALLENGSVRAAAAQVGITERAVYNRMQKPTFKRCYKAARTKSLEAATSALQARLSRAVDVLADCMQNEENAPQVRVNAANAIIDRAVKMSELCDIMPRLEALEKMQEGTTDA